jgi:hypothetical protein
MTDQRTPPKFGIREALFVLSHTGNVEEAKKYNYDPRTDTITGPSGKPIKIDREAQSSLDDLRYLGFDNQGIAKAVRRLRTEDS